jgi:hypothetical protein
MLIGRLLHLAHRHFVAHLAGNHLFLKFIDQSSCRLI